MNTSIRTRVLLSLLVIAMASAAVLSWYFLRELEAYGLRKLEERLGSEAQLMALLVGALDPDDVAGLEDALQQAGPNIYSRLIVLDADGVSVADSAGDDATGASYADRPEIATALGGGYGAYTRTADDGRLALYVAFPIEVDGEVTGVAYSSAETFSIMTLVRDYRGRLLVFIALFAGITLVIAEVLTRWLTRPLRQLEAGATALAAGDYSARVPRSGSRETVAVGEAFNMMADRMDAVVSELKAEERRKSQFISDVSHELRTPLTAIRGTAETLLEGDVPAQDAQRFLTTIVRESDRLARLADELLTLQRIEGATGELPVSRVELATIAENAIEALEPLAERRGVTVELAGQAPAVLGDADRLQQVVANLVDNASRMMSEGGTVRVELGHEGDFATLAVIDQGPGIPAEDLPHLFDRFYRAQPSRDRTTGGTGLGLAIVRAIIERHAGEIIATNEPGGGARFTVRLPALRD